MLHRNRNALFGHKERKTNKPIKILSMVNSEWLIVNVQWSMVNALLNIHYSPFTIHQSPLTIRRSRALFH
jgi:hypothetical protein